MLLPRAPVVSQQALSLERRRRRRPVRFAEVQEQASTTLGKPELGNWPPRPRPGRCC
jgi:hypothetical protein